MKAWTSALVAAVSLTGCNQNRPEWQYLEAPEGQDYIAKLRTFENGYAAKPFHLEFERLQSPEFASIIVIAEHCRNVDLIQTADVAYIFYDELELRSHSTERYTTAHPEVLLCNGEVAVCADLRAELISEGTLPISICNQD